MENVVYKNHKQELNEVVSHIFSNKYQIILYHSQSGYGNTSFLSRCQYLLHKTESLQLFWAELSHQESNPLHYITKNIASKKGILYHQMQLFTDEELGVTSIPLPVSIIKDITQSDTLASFFDRKAAPPIYTGFYQDRLKELFFELINKITLEKRVIIFIDNVQFIDNESVYELSALLKNPKITFVLSKSGEGEYFDKFYYETKYVFSEIELPFPEPNIEYVKELGNIYGKNLSSSEADLLLSKSHKNVRKLLFHLREPNMSTFLDDLQQQIVKTLYLYNDYIYVKDLLKICHNGPYKNIIDQEVIQSTLRKLEELDLLISIVNLNDREKSYKLLNGYTPYIDIADKLIINKSLLMFYANEKNLNYEHLKHAWQIAYTLKERTILEQFSFELMKTALELGFSIDYNVIKAIEKNNAHKTQIMVATFLFCNANYKEAKNILVNYADNTANRSIKVMYAITLNRCREHILAESELAELIKTSSDIDELAILVTFLISNHVHNSKISEAKDVFHIYQPKLANSKKYAYFLRNAATIFEPCKAYKLRDTAKNLFKVSNDMFGYYSTIINMTSYFVNNTSPDYAISQVLMAFEGLLSYNANQIHLAANNLGICYLHNNNYVQAIKYFKVAIENAKTIMPIAYASINLSNAYLKMGDYQEAYTCMQNMNDKIVSSNLPRLKARFYLHTAVIEYVKGNDPNVRKACINADKYSLSVTNKKIDATIKLLLSCIDNRIPYQNSMWQEVCLPCYLEYWTINTIDILSKDILSLEAI